MKQKFTRALAATLAVLTLTPLFTSCTGADKYKTYSYAALDTAVTVKISAKSKNGGSLSSSAVAEIVDECESIIAELDLSLNLANENSEVYALNHNANMLVSKHDTIFSVYEMATRITALTHRAYDCTAGALALLWADGKIPTDAEITEALGHIGADEFSFTERTAKKLDPEAKLDLRSIGEGYTAQKLLEYIASTYSACGVVSVGNTVGVFGEKAKHSTFKLGVKTSDGKLLGNMYVASGFISTASVEDGIIDPRTGEPASSGLREAVVYTSNGASSAALASALLVLGLDDSLALYNSGEADFEAILVTSDAEVIVTDGITDEMFELTSREYKLGESES